MNQPLVLEEWDGEWVVLRPDSKGAFFIGHLRGAWHPIHSRTGDLVAMCPTREAAVAALRLLS